MLKKANPLLYSYRYLLRTRPVDDNLSQVNVTVPVPQELMTTVQQQLNEFKASQRQSFQQLQKEEDVLERELEMFERRLESDAWNDSLVVHSKPPAPTAPSCSVTQKVLASLSA